LPGLITTHVLDTARGRPAANVAVELWLVEPDGSGRTLLRAARTNADGRTDAPLLAGDELRTGCYELVFGIGDYFGSETVASGPPFLDRVPVRFGVADPGAHYHVPLLVSRFAYSTYRGS
jgi:5-hydroxyisourate hydrolase